jgi:hypothetical protein
MSSSSPLGWGLLILLLASVVALWIVYLRNEFRRREATVQQQRDIDTLKQTVGALCSSAVGVDRRVNRLERQGRDLEERQDHMEQQTHTDEPPYTDAIRMVQDGAGPEQLVNELGISRDAADLIIMMHGVKG